MLSFSILSSLLYLIFSKNSWKINVLLAFLVNFLLWSPCLMVLTAFDGEWTKWIIERENIQASLTRQDQMSPATAQSSTIRHDFSMPSSLTALSSWWFHCDKFLRRNASGWWDYLWSHHAWWSMCQATTFCHCDELRWEIHMMIDSRTSVSDRAIVAEVKTPPRTSTVYERINNHLCYWQ